MTLPDVITLERALEKNWPAIKTVIDGSWVWRFSKGLTGRANSLWFYDSRDKSDALMRLAKHAVRSREFGIVPTVRVTPLMVPEVADLLELQGWSEHGNTQVLAKGLIRQEFLPSKLPIKEIDPTCDQWLEIVLELNQLPQRHGQAYREMMQHLTNGANGSIGQGFAIEGEHGGYVCCVLATISEGIGAVFGLQSAPTAQRMGLGRALMEHSINWMAQRGASCLALQVVQNNQKALRLYSSMGFENVYKYHYRFLKRAN